MLQLDRQVSQRWIWILFALLAILSCAVSCSKTQDKALATEVPQKTFVSPDDAGTALVNGAQSANHEAMLAIFGPGSNQLVYSGDAAEDKASFNGFATSYSAMHRWRKLDDSEEILLVGADNQAFPIPLKKNASGQWAFDTAAGKEELIARRIGDNELAALDICAAIAGSQAEYFSQSHGGVKQYAQKFISDEGQQNGLYWPSPEGKPRSPLGPLVAFASEEGYQVKANQHAPFHGYYFRELLKQGADAQGGAKNYLVNGKMTGGFAYVAYPAEYANSGIKTLMINQQGTVYEKDLGKTTPDIAASMTEFNPDKSWKPVQP